jgi:hypothetical protein
VIGQDQIDYAVLKAAEYGPIGSRPADLALPVAGPELNAARIEVPDSFRPDAPPKTAEFLWPKIRMSINYPVNRHYNRRLSDGSGDSDCAQKLASGYAPCHDLTIAPRSTMVVPGTHLRYDSI